ncbi:helix-turn-helix domain-containing protein [Nocardiopsis composta]
MAEQSTRTVERALDLLAAVADRGEASLTECARLADLAPSTALRLLRTLESAGFVQRDDEGAFRPGHRLIGIGAKALGHDALAATAQPSLHELARASGESGYLCVGTPTRGALHRPGRGEPDHPARQLGRPPVPPGRLGHRAGAARGDPEEGWVAAASVVEPDVVAVAAPVRAPTGTVAALSVVGPAYRLTGERVRELGEMVLAEAEHVSAKLGASAEEPAPGEGRSR